MNALLVLSALLALASPIFGDDGGIVEASKKQEKRGIVNLGYGGHYLNGGLHGLAGYAGYGGYGHGYVPSAPIYSLPAHGIGHGWNHGVAAAPSVVHGYSAAPAIATVAPYSHGYNHQHVPSLLAAAAPWRVGYTGYNGLHGAPYGHGLHYGSGW